MTESQFSVDILDAEVYIPVFCLFRGDRTFVLDRSKENVEISTGGGSLIYVKNIFPASEISSFKAPDSLAISIKTPIGNITVACIYRSGSLNKSQDRQLLSSLRHLCTSDLSNEMIMVGDFNMRDVSWVTGNVVGSEASISNEYMDMIADSGLNWYITDQITRRRLVQGYGKRVPWTKYFVQMMD